MINLICITQYYNKTSVFLLKSVSLKQNVAPYICTLYIRNVYHPLSHLRVHTESRSREDVNEGERKVGIYKRRAGERSQARMR